MRHGNGPGIRSNRRECAGKELSAGLVSVVTNRTYTIWLTLAGGRSPVIYLFNLGASASSQAGGEGGPVGLKRLTSWSGAQALLKKTSRVGAARPLDK